jgi:hypothetical protein
MHGVLELPRIIVCGSQSSGKSSVLETIVGIPFLRKSRLCTRYKIQVTALRRAEVGERVEIISDRSCSPKEITDLKHFGMDLGGSDWCN